MKFQTCQQCKAPQPALPQLPTFSCFASTSPFCHCSNSITSPKILQILLDPTTNYPWKDPNKGIQALVKFSLTYTCCLLFKSPRHQNVRVNEPERWKSDEDKYDWASSYLSTQFLRQFSVFPSSRLLGFPNGSMQVWKVNIFYKIQRCICQIVLIFKY